MGGGGRYPYPKHVWSPAGGWWVRPSNWKSNTFIYALGVGVITYGVFQYSSQRETRYQLPQKGMDSWTFQSRQIRELREKKPEQ